MAKRRGNHEGSIHRLPSGSYRAQITLQGNRISFTAQSKKQCLEWIRSTYRQIDDGLSYSDTKTTLTEYMTQWLIAAQSLKRHSTWSQHKQIFHKYIDPLLGQIKLKDLRPAQIQGVYTKLLAQGVGAYTVLKIHTVLHSALQQAVKMGMIGRNPVSLTQPPKEPTKEMSILNETQISQFLGSVIGHRWEALFHLALVTGARQMELLGLKWVDLDWNHQTLKIERQLLRPNGNGVEFSVPKTKFGMRSIALGNKTIQVLRRHFERQQRERIAAGANWQEYELIFTTSNGTPIHPRNLLRDFKILLRNAGLPPRRFHDLRHAAASLMLNNNIAPIIVSRRLGHAKASITLDVYAHLIPSMQTEAAEMIDELITPILIGKQEVTAEPISMKTRSE